MTQDISFTAQCDGSLQRYVLVLPDPFGPCARHDVLVALHGLGSDRWQFVKDPRDECRAAREMAQEHRMIFVSPDYRASSSWMGPKAERDLVQILGEMRDRFFVRKVFLTGGSMGGAAALTFAVLHPDLLHGVASMNGSADLSEVKGFEDSMREAFSEDGKPFEEELKMRSAGLWPERLTMPVGLTAGGKDASVPSGSILKLHQSLKSLGRKVFLLYRPEGGHVTDLADARAILEFAFQGDLRQDVNRDRTGPG